MNCPTYQKSDEVVTRPDGLYCLDCGLAVPDLDDDHPLWCINSQIQDLLIGVGASEDHEAVLSFFRATGLPEGTVKRVHKAIVCAEK